MDAPLEGRPAAASAAPASAADPAPSFDRGRFRRLFVAVMALTGHPAVDPRIGRAFQIAFAAAAALCLLGAWAASRVPAIRFGAEEKVAPPPVD